MKRILVTGSAGFIGAAVSDAVLASGSTVVGFDNHNDYYELDLKEARTQRLCLSSAYRHVRGGLEDTELVMGMFREFEFDTVVHLAAQAGVRYSLENPLTYINSNVLGFANILEGCRHFGVKHLVYASSSSVYGANTSMPFSVHDNVDHPFSLYAATKKANELMAHSYSHLYGLPTTGLRFFTVYGPWGRPDMAPFKFARAIVNHEPLKVYNYGKHRRDFTYIDDIVEGVIRVMEKPPTSNASWSGDAPDPSSSTAPWRVYNIGNSAPVELMEFISELEAAFGIEAEKELLPMQPGDVPDTYADVEALKQDFGYRPKTTVREGVGRFVEWYRDYYQV